MGVLGGTIAYHFLRRYAGAEVVGALDGSAYHGKSKLRVLLGDALIERIRDKDVLDFGCGAGAEVVELAQLGAKSVVGVDIQSDRFADAIVQAQHVGVADRVSFQTQAKTPVDIVVSIDSFEHFADPAQILASMASHLRPEGCVLVSFGPTWYHPLGGHLFSVFPWAHLLFTEEALIRWRSDFKSDGATRFAEVAGGLNQMTIARFERIVAASPFRIVKLEAVPIRRLARVANRFTREFTTAIVRCTLVLRGSAATRN